MASARKETHAVSAMTRHLETEAIRDKKDNRPLLHRKQRHRQTERYPQNVQAAEEQAFLEQEGRFRAEIGYSVRTRHVVFGTLPLSEITSLNQDASVAVNVISDNVEADEKPSKKSKKGGAKGSVALLKEYTQLHNWVVCPMMALRGSLF